MLGRRVGNLSLRGWGFVSTPPPPFPFNVTYFAYKCRTRPRSFRLSSSPLTLCCQFKGVKFVELPCGSPIACRNLHVATLKNCHLPSAQLTLLHSWMCWLFYYNCLICCKNNSVSRLTNVSCCWLFATNGVKINSRLFASHRSPIARCGVVVDACPALLCY